MTPDEMIAIIQAHKEGKPLQYKKRHGSLRVAWIDRQTADPTFNFHENLYRVKPCPQEIYVVEYVSHPDPSWGYWSKDKPPACGPKYNRVRKFVEVLE